MKHLLSSLRQLRVASDAFLQIVLALSVPTQVNGMGVYGDVHEVVDYLTLDIVLNPVDQKTAADIDDLDEGQAPAGQSKKINVNQKCLSDPSKLRSQ